MSELRATVEDLISWRPCSGWTDERIGQIAGDKTEWTALEVLALESVHATDRLWVVFRRELISEPLLHEIACRFADSVLPNWEKLFPKDTRPRDAIAAKRAWLRGEIADEQLATARSAAWAAAWAAESAAAWSAARSAATSAATAAAWSAVSAAVSASAWSVQIEIVREVLLALKAGGES